MTSVIEPKDVSWPDTLNEGAHPAVKRLFVRGKPLDPTRPAVAVVGTRRPTAAGLFAAKEIATGLALGGYTVVSGLAVGIDAVAHRAALEAGGSTVAVLGCGHDIDYPQRNRSLRRAMEADGTVIAEYPPDTQPQPWMFPLRNRIIAGLSIAVVVVEGTIRSGALVTARLALDANREVFAVPGSVRNVMAEGPNELIRRGEAALVVTAEQVIESLGGLSLAAEGPTLPPVELSIEQEKVLAHLDDVPESVDAFAKATGLSGPDVMAALALLELDRFVRRTMRGYVITDAGAAIRARVLQGGDRVVG